MLCLATTLAATATIAHATTYIVSTTNDGGTGSLRDALLRANATASRDTIRFDINVRKTVQVATITPMSPLPTITSDLVIDASVSAPRTIELDGVNAGATSNGLTISAGNCMVRGLNIVRFGGAAIRISDAGGNTIVANRIGTDPGGTSARGNGTGIYIDRSPSNVIGGEDAASRNIISGNSRYGVEVFGGAATSNRIVGNYIGTNSAGTATLGNGTGIIINDAPGNVIGGSNTGMRNVISGNRGAGIIITADGSSYGPASANSIQGNYVGLDASGSIALGNGDGITIGGAATNTRVGGYAPNVVSGNGVTGITINGSLSYASTNGNRIAGNFVGTDRTGTVGIGNSIGIVVKGFATDNVIGDGNLISGNAGDGVQILGTAARHNVIYANRIGTDATGTAGIANGGSGVHLEDASDNVIGANAAGNVVSGNGKNGIDVHGARHRVIRNIIIGNIIGADRTGSRKLGNGGNGIALVNADSTTIGGAFPGAGNMIAANFNGVQLDSSNANRLCGNVIGLGADGTTPLGNVFAGVLARSSEMNEVGGVAVGEGNVISANGTGVRFTEGARGNIVHGNLIGLDSSGRTGVGNVNDGIFLDNAADNTIGDTLASGGNVISANGANGIRLLDVGAQGNRIIGNTIGGDRTGDLVLGNAHSGILVRAASDNVIGGVHPPESNRISGNGLDGITVDSSSKRIAIRRNRISDNDGLGIDLGGDGVTINDTANPAARANDGQTYPTLVSASVGSIVMVTGSLDAMPNARYTIDLFMTYQPDATGFGEGGECLGSVVVNTDDEGHAEFVFSTSAGGTLGTEAMETSFVSATATDSLGNSSEYSRVISVRGNEASVPSSARSANDHVSVSAHPNPLSTSTSIVVSLPEQSTVRVTISTITGEEISTIVDERLERGMHAMQWNAVDASGLSVPNGNYICRVQTGSACETSMIVVRR